MTSEAIVRALAAADPITSDEGCQFCWQDVEGSKLCGRAPEPHKPDCPWRLAREWVAEQEGGPADDEALPTRGEWRP